MAKKIQSIKGFYDVPPQRQKLWRFMESKILSVLDQYGFQEIGLPMLESTDLFTAGVGTHTDIVEKEMYSWTDPLNNDDLTLRPEGTAGCVRALIEGSLTYNGPIKLFYRGPMFRHENVQKGRQRQFHQVGVEAFGYDDASSDAEQILLLKRLWKNLGLKNIELQLNTIGDPSDRELYRKALIDYFEKNKSILDDDAQRRLYENPLRILDSKNPKMQDMLNNAPKLKDFISKDSLNHFDMLCNILDNHGVEYSLNNRLVRGLDYYNRTVFEYVTDDLGSQGTVAGGGRFDYLVEKLGGDKTPACGFALGLERIILLLETKEITHQINPDIYILNLGHEARTKAGNIAELLRDHNFKIAVNLDGASFKSQMKKADKSGAKIALILGDDEVVKKSIKIKLLREEVSQEDILQKNLLSYLKSIK
ncbi:MAG: histidine--tRNA ligase [Methylophilaceae bacterium]|tara:strand:- start:267 stop:1529 length:1263 start_codon:yes stop_codon:yes gene_type:complete